MRFLGIQELKYHAASWLGLLLVMVTAGGVASFAASLIEAAFGAEANELQGLLLSFGSLIVMFSGIACGVVVSGIVDQAIVSQQQSVARWHLVGVPPRSVKWILRTQVMIVAFVGSAVGHLMAIPVHQSLFDSVISSLMPGTSSSLLTLGLSPTGAVASIVICALFAYLATGKGVARAITTPALHVLREPEDPTLHLGWRRWALASCTAALTMLLALSLPHTRAEDQSAWIFVPVLVTAIVAILSPAVLPAVMAGWTRIVPERTSLAWHLARRSALFRLTSSTSSISPLMTIVSLTAGIYSSTSILAGVYGGSGDEALPLGGAVLILGGPAVVTTVGSAVALLIAGRVRARNMGLLTALGASRRLVARTAFVEAVIYAATAGIVALVSTVVSALLITQGISRVVPGISFHVELAAAAVVLAVGFVLLAASTVFPVLRALRGNPTVQLAVEH